MAQQWKVNECNRRNFLLIITNNIVILGRHYWMKNDVHNRACYVKIRRIRSWLSLQSLRSAPQQAQHMKHRIQPNLQVLICKSQFDSRAPCWLLESAKERKEEKAKAMRFRIHPKHVVRNFWRIQNKLTSLDALLLYPRLSDPIMGELPCDVIAALSHSSSTSLILASQWSLQEWWKFTARWG